MGQQEGGVVLLIFNGSYAFLGRIETANDVLSFSKDNQIQSPVEFGYVLQTSAHRFSVA